MIYALRDRLAGAGYGYRAFRGIGQHLRGDLDGGAGDLADLLDLGAPLADQGAALRRRDDQSERDRRPRHTATSAGTAALHVVELGAPFLKFLAYQRERFEDRVGRSGDSHYPLRAGTVGNIDLRAGLRTERALTNVVREKDEKKKRQKNREEKRKRSE